MFSQCCRNGNCCGPFSARNVVSGSTGATHAWGLTSLVEEHVSLQKQSCKFCVWDQCRRLRLGNAAGSWGELSWMGLPETQTLTK